MLILLKPLLAHLLHHLLFVQDDLIALRRGFIRRCSAPHEVADLLALAPHSIAHASFLQVAAHAIEIVARLWGECGRLLLLAEVVVSDSDN